MPYPAPLEITASGFVGKHVFFDGVGVKNTRTRWCTPLWSRNWQSYTDTKTQTKLGSLSPLVSTTSEIIFTLLSASVVPDSAWFP